MRAQIASHVKQEWRGWIESLGLAMAIALLINVFLAQSFRVDGASMEPSLFNGERVMLEKVTYRVKEPARGDVIVLRVEGESQPYIKRIVGLPGDQIEVDHHQLVINGVPLNEDYTYGPTYGDFGPLTVPNGTYFVMGDNRNNSLDSRFPTVGPVKRTQIVGRAIFRYWPVTCTSSIRAPKALQEPSSAQSS